MRPRRRVETCPKLKEKDKATVCSPSEERILPAASTIKTRGQRVCGRFRRKYAHGQQERPELSRIGNREDIEKSDDGGDRQRVPTTEGATEDVKEVDLFAFTRKTLRRSRVSLPLDQWSETTSHQKRQTDRRQHGELRTIRDPWSIDKLFKLIFTYFSYIFIAG